MSDFSPILNKIKKLEAYLQRDLPRKIGIEAVNHFKDSFQNGGFTDQNLKKWENAKRRIAESSWHGFKYRSRVERPGVKRRKEDSITNYSPAATERPTMTGETGNLKNSIDYIVMAKTITIYSNTPYSQIHNEGGKVRVFGKGTANMPQRQFMGDSQALRNKLKTIVERDIKRILS